MAKPHSDASRVTTCVNVASHTGGFLRKQLWVWPLIAAAMLAFVGLWVRGQMEDAMRTQIACNLKTILDANAEALRNWATTVKSQAEVLAEDEAIRTPLTRLVDRIDNQGASPTVLLTAPEVAALRKRLSPAVQERGFSDYAVLTTNLVVLAAGREQFIGMTSPPGFAEQFQTCFGGKTSLTLPFPSLALQPDEHGNLRAGVPTMFVTAPVRSAEGRVVAALGLRIAPEKDFTRIIATARAGRSGETYAFNRKGLLLSQSRFDEQLKRLNLLPDSSDAQSILTVELRDPLVELGPGRSSPKPRNELGLTKSVSEAVAGRDGVDVLGYRDYRGIPVAGAWAWLQDFNWGLVTEIDVAEAFAPLRAIRLGFWFLFTLLTLGSGIVFVLMRVASGWHTKAKAATLKAQQLGQYALDKEIGAGGFGTVFRAHHALMRRPVAVKVLNPAADERSIARFEREVQLTCQLTHPNTIALYDYGRTPDGLFYYAMEYLEGLSLDRLIKRYGAQPEGRVIHILLQVCASLAEAHGQGLIHRDIKPQNIFLTRRGGIPDFVKVLDFGLVKACNVPDQVALTSTKAMLGTPLYMSPEAVQNPEKVDAVSDLYCVGMVGYELLTGATPFSSDSLGDLVLQQLRVEPEKPSVRLKRPVSADLEQLLMQCLAKSPAARPSSAVSLAEALGGCKASGSWGRRAAEEWWSTTFGLQDNNAATVQESGAPGLKTYWERFL